MRCTVVAVVISGIRAKKSAVKKIPLYALLSTEPSSGLSGGIITASGIAISPLIKKAETIGLTMQEAIIPTAEILPIAPITIGRVNSCAPTEAERLCTMVGGSFPRMSRAHASPKSIIPAQAPYDSINPSVTASLLPNVICTVNIVHSIANSEGLNPKNLPKAAIKIIPKARFNEGADPANHTKRLTAISEHCIAHLLCPNKAPPCSAAVLINERCIPDSARICASPALRNAVVHSDGKKFLSAANNASSSPPAFPHS